MLPIEQQTADVKKIVDKQPETAESYHIDDNKTLESNDDYVQSSSVRNSIQGK